MKKMYTAGLCFCILLFAGCSKDFLKRYDKRIVGTWRISNVNNAGLFGNTSGLAFTSGTFTFFDNGTLAYSNAASDTLTGTWDIVKKLNNDDWVQSLQVTAVDFIGGEVLTEYYDDMTFLGTDHFTASTNTTFTTYITHFRR